MNNLEKEHLICKFKAGYKLVPAPFKLKHPILPDWGNQYFRTEEALRTYLESNPNTNMAIVPLDEWIVLDVDRHLGNEDYSKIEPLFVPTYIVESGGNGKHYYYKKPVGFNRKLRRKLKGYNTVEIQVNSMCLIAPGSTHPNGNKYMVSRDSIDEITEIPPALLELCIDDTPDNDSRVSSNIQIRDIIPIGMRNIALTSEAGKLYRKNLDDEQVWFLLKKINEDKCEIPLPEKELKSIQKSVKSYDNYSQAQMKKKTEEDMTISEQIEDIIKAPKMKQELKIRLICNTLIKYFSTNGFIFYKSNGNFYLFDNQSKLLIWLDKGNRNLKRLIYTCGINPASELYKYVFEALCAHSDINGVETEVFKYSHVDTLKYCIYLKNGNNVLKITADKIELCDNGIDNVLFTDAVDVEPFIFIDNISDDYLNKYLFDMPNYNGTSYLTPSELKSLVTIYFNAMFMADYLKTKPIISTVGTKGSGKTSLLRMMIKCIYGAKSDVISMTNKLEDLDTIAAKRHAVFIDNLDTYKDSINDKLATYATGITNEKRMLYSNGEVYRENIDAFIGISTRNPVFRRDDVAQRVLIIYLDTLKEYKTEAAVIEPMLKHRNEIISQVIKDLQQILMRMKKESGTGEYCSAFRMADFAHFTALYFGDKERAETLLEKVSKNQKALATENDILFTYITKFVAQVQDDGWYNAKKLYQILDGLAADEVVNTLHKNEFREKYENAVSLAKRLMNIKEDVSEFVNIETKKKRGNITFYRITAGENFEDWRVALL